MFYAFCWPTIVNYGTLKGCVRQFLFYYNKVCRRLYTETKNIPCPSFLEKEKLLLGTENVLALNYL